MTCNLSGMHPMTVAVVDATRGAACVQIGGKEGRVRVFLVKRPGGAWIPVEVRARAEGPASRSAVRGELDSWEPPKRPERLSLNELRGLSLAEVHRVLDGERNLPAERRPAPSKRRKSTTKEAQELGFRRGIDLDAARMRLDAAERYARHSAIGSSSPIHAVAEEMRVSENKARALVRLARADGYLTSVAPGVAGGALTALARQRFQEIADYFEGVTK